MSSSPSHSVSYASGMSSTDIDQFLSLHGVSVVRQGTNARWSPSNSTLLTDCFGSFQGFFNPAGLTIDLPFIFNSHVTTSPVTNNVTVRLPITINEIVSSVVVNSNLTPSLFEQAVDCTVMIVGDNGYGDPNMSQVYGSTLLPKEYVAATSSSAWPEPQESLLGGTLGQSDAWNTDSITKTPIAVLEGYSNLVYTTAGSWAIGCGGSTSANVPSNSVVYAQYSDGALSSWTAGPSFPKYNSTNYYIPQSLPYAPISEVLMLTGVGYGATTNGTQTSSHACYTATFTQSGAMSAWQRQTDLPYAVQNCYSTIATLTDPTGNAQDYALVFDASRNNIYYGTVGNDGSISQWTTASNQNIVSGQPFALGTITNAAGVSVTSIATVADEGGATSVSSVSLSASGQLTFSPWVITPTGVLATAGASSISTLSGVFGNTISAASNYTSLIENTTVSIAADSNFSNFSNNGVYQAAPLGIGGPLGTNGASWVFSNGDGTYTAIGVSAVQVTGQSVQLSTNVYPVTWVNVPIALTSSMTSYSGGNLIRYHLILQFSASNGVSEGVNVASTMSLGATQSGVNAQSARYLQSSTVTAASASAVTTTINASGMSGSSIALYVSSLAGLPSSGQISVPASGGTLVFSYGATTTLPMQLTDCTLVSGSPSWTITNGATATATLMTYTCPNSLLPGESVTVAGFTSPSIAFNVTSAPVTSASPLTFTVSVATGATGAATMPSGAVTATLWNTIFADTSYLVPVEVPWQIWIGSTTPNGSYGNVLGFIDDTNGKTSYLWYSTMTNKLLAAAQWSGNMRSCQVLDYDLATGQLVSINEVE